MERLLTARSERRLQILQATIEPRGRGENELYAVDCDVDVLHVVKGRIKLILTNEEYDLEEGGTRSPSRAANPTPGSTPRTRPWRCCGCWCRQRAARPTPHEVTDNAHVCSKHGHYL